MRVPFSCLRKTFSSSRYSSVNSRYKMEKLKTTDDQKIESFQDVTNNEGMCLCDEQIFIYFGS